MTARLPPWSAARVMDKIFCNICGAGPYPNIWKAVAHLKTHENKKGGVRIEMERGKGEGE